MTSSERRDLAARLTAALAAHNEAYRTGLITRDEWVTGNRGMQELAKPLGWTLPPLALS